MLERTIDFYYSTSQVLKYQKGGEDRADREYVAVEAIRGEMGWSSFKERSAEENIESRTGIKIEMNREDQMCLILGFQEVQESRK